jgi:chromosome segregation ATPase
MEADPLAEAIRRQQPSAVELFRDELRALLSGRWMNDLSSEDVLPYAREELSQQVEQLRSTLESVHERQRLSAIRQHLSDRFDEAVPETSTWVEEEKTDLDQRIAELDESLRTQVQELDTTINRVDRLQSLIAEEERRLSGPGVPLI